MWKWRNENQFARLLTATTTTPSPPPHPNYLQRLSPNPTTAANVLKSRIPLLPGKSSPMVSPHQSRSQLENWRGHSGERTGAM